MGRISHSRCTSHKVATASGRILAAFRSRLLASSPTFIFRSAFRHSYPTNGLGLLVIADTVGSSTWKAGIPALSITSVEDTASTYDFHATHGKTSLCKNRFHMFTWLLRIPNTLIYISFRVAQDHNKAAGRDRTSSTPSWTRREDPAATTRRRSFSFICVLNCFLSCRTLVWSLVNLFYFLLLWTILDMTACMLYVVFCLFWMLHVRGGSQNIQ
jgi:hypothetical protein